MPTPPLPTVDGIQLRLRPVRPDDAAYLHRLRTDPRYGTHLSPVTGTVADQRAWIEAYQTRAAAGHEAYFIIERRDGVPCGTVRLYDIAADRFTWGSWILDEGKPPKAALESAVLSFGVGFESPARTQALIDVRHDNTRALAFYRRLGMAKTGADALNTYFTYPRDRYLADRPAHLAVVQAAAERSE